MSNKLGQAIATARGARSPEEFAVLFEVSAVTVWRWESGRSVPRSRAHRRVLVQEGVPEPVIDAAVAAARQQVAS